jgi:hypothetical protein
MAANPPGQSCATCRFWKSNAFSDGQCRLNPPTVYGEEHYKQGYPTTYADNWCGQWEPASPKSFSEATTVIARLVVIGDRSGVYAMIDKLQEERTQEDHK